VGGRLQGERMYLHLQLIHVVVQQKLSPHCKPIILQLKKINEMNNKKGVNQLPWEKIVKKTYEWDI